MKCLGLYETSNYTINLILRINELMNVTKESIKNRLPKIYSAELVNHLFENMYTKNELFRNSLNVARATATKYLKELVEEGYLVEERVDKEVVYKNIQLLNIFK